MRRNTLLSRVKNAVLAVDLSAEVILYGSRARGDARRDSDWDFLVLLPSPVDDEITRTIRHTLYEIEWDTGNVISCIVRNRDAWDADPLAHTPLRQRVAEEGIPI